MTVCVCVCVCVCASHGEVIPEQLHDESAVLVGVLLQLVQLSNGVIESLSRRERQLYKYSTCIHSGTSDNGHSEKQTTSVERTMV